MQPPGKNLGRFTDCIVTWPCEAPTRQRQQNHVIIGRFPPVKTGRFGIRSTPNIRPGLLRKSYAPRRHTRKLPIKKDIWKKFSVLQNIRKWAFLGVLRAFFESPPPRTIRAPKISEKKT